MRSVDLPIYQRQGDLEEEEESRLENLKQSFSLLTLLLITAGIWSGRITVLKGLLPMGISYFAFFLYYKEKSFVNRGKLLFVLLSISVGYLSQLGWIGTKYFLPCCLLLLVGGYLQKLRIVAYSLVVGILFLLLQFPYVYFELVPLDWLMLGAETIIIVLFTMLLTKKLPTVLEVLNQSKFGVRLLSLAAVSVGLIVSFFSFDSWLKINFMRLLGAYLTLIFALVAGPTTGAMTGIVMGASYNLTHLTAWPLVGNYAVSGLIAGKLKKLRKLGVAIGFILGSVVYVVFVSQAQHLLVVLQEGIAAGVFLLFTPQAVISDLKRLITEKPRDEQLEGRQLEAFVTQRVNQFSEIFKELSTTFSEVLPDRQEDETDNLGTFLELVTDKVCCKCELSDSCWRQSFYITYKSFFNLLAIAENRGQVTTKDLEQKMKIECPRKVKLATAINEFVKMYELNNYWQARLEENEEILLNQLSGMSQVIDNLAEELTLEVQVEKEVETKVHSLLEQKGLAIERVLATNYNGENLELTIRKESCEGSQQCLKQIIPLLENKLGYNLNLIWNECGAELEKQTCVCRFAPGSEYQIQTGVAAASQLEGVSGDNYTYFTQKEGDFIAILSDGMGVGKEANQESKSAVSLLEKMLQAGLNYKTALQTVNSILSLRSQEDNFATIDLLKINQLTGEAEFIKVGSVSSFIKRGNEVSMVKASTLPVGILNQIEVEPSCLQLEDKDIVIMLTDGVLDSKQNLTIKEEWVLQVLKNNLLEDPQSLAQYILEKAQKNSKAGDDMTVLVIRIDKC